MLLFFCSSLNFRFKQILAANVQLNQQLSKFLFNFFHKECTKVQKGKNNQSDIAFSNYKFLIPNSSFLTPNYLTVIQTGSPRFLASTIFCFNSQSFCNKFSSNMAKLAVD